MPAPVNPPYPVRPDIAVGYTYDGLGNVLTYKRIDVVNGFDVVFWQEYTRNAQGFPLTYATSMGYSATYTYDGSNRLLTMVDNEGYSSTYTYYTDGRPKTFVVTYREQIGGTTSTVINLSYPDY